MRLRFRAILNCMRITRVSLLASVFSLFAFGQGSLADYQRSAALRDRTLDLDLHIVDTAQAIDRTNRFWYRRTTPGGFEFILVDGVTGAKSPAFDAARLAAALSKAANTEFKPLRLPFTAINFTDDGTAVEFFASESRWRVSISTYICEKIALRAGDPRPLKEL